MTAGLTGNPANLKALAAKLRQVPIRVATKAAAKIAPKLTELARASFAAGENPYGDTWEPGAKGQRVDLVESGALRGQLRFAAIGTRVRAVLGVRYAKYQIGKRKILPIGGSAMPVSWSSAIGEIVTAEIASDLAGAS